MSLSPQDKRPTNVLLEQNTVKPTMVSAQHQKRQRISNEVVKPLLLTLLLHGGLVGLGIWYWQSQPTKLAATQTPLAKPATKSTQIIAAPITTSAVTSHQSTWAVSPLQSLQQISLLFSPYAKTDISLLASAATPPPNHTAKDGKNLSRVATDDHLSSLPPMPATSQVVTVAAPITQVLTERDIPSPKQTAATTTSKPYLAKTPLDKKVRELTTAIEDDNKQLSELIDQVKKHNQQQIDQQTTIE
ncbi:hypothetical protein GCM10010099_23310 [Streptomyces cinereus]|nr:hypothetical protein GCM10010099_23310 [Streptomyces cinereus]